MVERYVWFDGEFLEKERVSLPLDCHALHYGSAVFEGIRAYVLKSGRVGIFRGKDHFKRFLNSAKALRMDVKQSWEELLEATKRLISMNGVADYYIRPIAFYCEGGIGLDPRKNKVRVGIFLVRWGKYLQEEVRVKVSSYRRPNALITNPWAKISGIYVNSILATLEARELGYDEALMLDLNGYIAEGPGENVFFVRKDERIAYTPPQGSILPGITRDTVRVLLEDMGYRVLEKNILLEDLPSFDEAFFVGTAAEVTPIREINGIKYQTSFSRKVREVYLKVVRGELEKYAYWVDLV